MSSSERDAIRLSGVSKFYRVYKRPIDRLLSMFRWNRDKKFYSEYWALRNVSLEVKRGEVVGVVGQNGAGKSTLLQLICKTLYPSSGTIEVDGKVSALLELGSGFNPEFSGRENVYMSCAIAGLSRDEIDRKFDEIVEFAGVREFIEQPVKTYSSGMMMRLAFCVATSIEPDILIIDEALSVGDGAFARKSFDRIMKLKESGCTILFCSHSLYQVEVLCDRVIWLERGKVVSDGAPSGVVGEYQRYLDSLAKSPKMKDGEVVSKRVESASSARIVSAKIFSDDNQEQDLKLMCDESTLHVEVEVYSLVEVQMAPSVGIVITDESGRNITSCGSFYDNVELVLDENGYGRCRVSFEKIGLRRGRYSVYVFLLCERAIHIYESILCGNIEMEQRGNELGVVSLRREWSVG